MSEPLLISTPVKKNPTAIHLYNSVLMSSSVMYITPIGPGIRCPETPVCDRWRWRGGERGVFRKFPFTGHVCLSVVTPNILEQPASFGLFVGVCLSRCDHMRREMEKLPRRQSSRSSETKHNCIAFHLQCSTASTCLTRRTRAAPRFTFLGLRL